jgi:hypothetical protein
MYTDHHGGVRSQVLPALCMSQVEMLLVCHVSLSANTDMPFKVKDLRFEVKDLITRPTTSLTTSRLPTGTLDIRVGLDFHPLTHNV